MIMSALVSVDISLLAGLGQVIMINIGKFDVNMILI
jgi:hypothetical protein